MDVAKPGAETAIRPRRNSAYTFAAVAPSLGVITANGGHDRQPTEPCNP